MKELRCDHKKFGELLDDDEIEFKCPSRFCGAEQGVIVIHRFDLRTGKVIKTMRFREPDRGLH